MIKIKIKKKEINEIGPIGLTAATTGIAIMKGMGLVPLLILGGFKIKEAIKAAQAFRKQQRYQKAKGKEWQERRVYEKVLEKMIPLLERPEAATLKAMLSDAFEQDKRLTNDDFRAAEFGGYMPPGETAKTLDTIKKELEKIFPAEMSQIEEDIRTEVKKVLIKNFTKTNVFDWKSNDFKKKCFSWYF